MNSCVSSIFRRAFTFVLLLTASYFFAQNGQPRYLIDSIRIEGNAKTRPRIILREFTCKVGDTLSENEIGSRCKRAQQNLMNTSLFVHDSVSYQIDTLAGTVTIQVKVQERWYLWPGLIFEIQDRNFNSWWETKDLFRINYGVSLTVYNLFGLSQTLTGIFRRGYTEQYVASYRIPFINKKQTLGLAISFNYYRNNEVWYRTFDDRLLFYRDYKKYVRRDREAKLGITHRHKLYIRESLELFFKTSSVSDTIARLNENYYAKGESSINYFSLQYRFAYDYRDYKPYPTKGYYIEASVIKDGFGLLSNETTDNLSLFGSIKTYFKLFHRTYMMTSLKGRYLPMYKPMYFFNRGLGYGEVVRGYEYYVIDGQHFALLKSNVRFQVIRPRVIRVPVKRFKKFNDISYALYVGPFMDAGYVRDNFFMQNNALSNELLMGAGLGVDLIAYYDLVFRVEFAVNRWQEPGIYLHLNAPL